MIPLNIAGALQAIRKTSSAMSALVIVITIICLSFIFSIHERDQTAIYMSFLLLFLLIIFFMLIFGYFAFHDPDRLHREDHVENKIALRNDIHIFKRSGDKIEAVRVKDQKNIANPLIREE